MNVEKSNTPQEEELRARAQAEYDRLKAQTGRTSTRDGKTRHGGDSPRREWTEATGGENGEKQTDGERQSIDSLVNSVSSQVATLVHDEVEYAKANVKAAIPKLTVGGVLVAAAALTGIFALLGGRKLKALKAHLASLSSLGANLAKDVAAIKNGMKK